MSIGGNWLKQRFRSFHRAIALGILATVSVGCSEGTVSQCVRLIDIANAAATEVETVTQSSTPDDTEAFLTIAETADQAATDLGTLELSDAQLQTFKQRFIQLYQETGKATRDLVAAVEAADREAAEAAYAQLEAATSQEEPLVEEVNIYCRATPTEP
ncbi:MAG: hypothetical protein VKK04_25395 [Synechococcales bacterium]|nr:hypothetical protein [Synechococcales bacterium]